MRKWLFILLVLATNVARAQVKFIKQVYQKEIEDGNYCSPTGTERYVFTIYNDSTISFDIYSTVYLGYFPQAYSGSLNLTLFDSKFNFCQKTYKGNLLRERRLPPTYHVTFSGKAVIDDNILAVTWRPLTSGFKNDVAALQLEMFGVADPNANLPRTFKLNGNTLADNIHLFPTMDKTSPVTIKTLKKLLAVSNSQPYIRMSPCSPQGRL